MKKEATKKETILLDGKNHGFCIYSMVTQDYVRNKSGKIVLFRNIDLARVYAAQSKKLYNPFDYNLYISIYDSIIDYEFFEFIDGYYQLYASVGDDENVKYFVKPIVNRDIQKIGYLVFNNGEREFDKEKGITKSNTYHAAVVDSLDQLIRNTSINPNITSITKDKYGLCVSLKDSTAKIHICYNNQIMSINQNRKLNNLRAFRYDKEMDKYTTLYVFIDIDASEMPKFESIPKALQILNYIAGKVVNGSSITSCEYKEVELLYPIFLEDNDIKRGFNKKG